MLITLTGCSSTNVEEKKALVPAVKAEVVAPVVQAKPIISFEKFPKFCNKINKRFLKYGWGKSFCQDYNWQKGGESVKGDPLIMTVFGEEVKKEGTDVTYIMCGVHGDEITPIKFCFDILKYLDSIKRGEVIDPHTGNVASFAGKQIIVSPLVNPDSFFKRRPTRTNANGVDVNRNLPTKDFARDALSLWSNRYRKDKRRFPGKVANSEPEAVFQVKMIEKFNPHKIISVHAPLTMLDYDGPSDRHTGGIIGSRANQLLIKMSENARGYRVKNYPFFPGSLGNYAGNERNIPTYTLELPSSDNRKSKKYWKLFKGSIHSAIMHNVSKDVDVAFESGKTESTN